MIGIFDSGIGGLTVVRAFVNELPGYDIVYFGDTARTPYGNKSPETVIRYAIENTEFLIQKGAKIIVMACNTASSLAFSQVAEEFDVPVFEVVTPAVELAVNTTTKSKIGIIGTRATVKSEFYEKKIREIDSNLKVFSRACPLLAPLVEEGWLKKPETSMIIKKYLHPLKVRQIDTLILGCTHYPLLKKIIQRKIGKRVNIIDSSSSVAVKVKNFLSDNTVLDNSLGKKNRFNIFVSDVTEQFKQTANFALKKKVDLELVTK